MFKQILSILFISLLIFPSSVHAQENAEKKLMTLPAGEIVDRDYFAASEVVEISGTVNGDVYAVGGQILVDGIVNGDLLVAGGTITITGNVSGDVRAAGGQILFSGNVGRNVSVVGGNIEFTDSAIIGGSIATAAGSVVLNSPVNGDINAAVGNLRLSSSANVSGDINYISEEEISSSETASVSGSVNRTRTPEYQAPSEQEVKGFFQGLDLFAKLSSLLTSLVIGLLMIRFLPNYTENAANVVNKRFLPSLGTGFLGLIVVPALIVVLFMTILGIPLAFLLGGAFILYLYVVRIFAMVAIGQKTVSLLKFKTNPYWIFAIGLVAYYVLTLIPILGGIIKLFVLIASFGAALINERDTWRKAFKAKVV